jgi:hypothetical protein
MVNDAGAVVKKPQVKRSIHFFVAAEITASDFN